MGFPGVLALSVIVTVAVVILPRFAPAGLLKVIVNASLPSLMLSSTIGMKMVFEVSPAAKRSVPTLVA